jgi:hypothetical protein
MNKQTATEFEQIETQLEQYSTSWLNGSVPYEVYVTNCQPLVRRQLEICRDEPPASTDSTPLSAQATYELLCDNPQAYLDWQQSVARSIAS